MASVILSIKRIVERSVKITHLSTKFNGVFSQTVSWLAAEKLPPFPVSILKIGAYGWFR